MRGGLTPGGATLFSVRSSTGSARIAARAIGYRTVMETVLIYLIPVVALAALFFLLWWLDARRSEKVEHDPERQDVTPDSERRDGPDNH